MKLIEYLKTDVTLIYYELLAVPASAVLAFVFLLIAGVTQFLITVIIGSSSVGLVIAYIIWLVLSAIVMGYYEIRYHRAIFETCHRTYSPVMAFLVPGSVLLVAMFLFLNHGGTSTPWWIRLLFIVAAYGMLFRVITLDSLTGRSLPGSLVVATIGLTPGMFAVVMGGVFFWFRDNFLNFTHFIISLGLDPDSPLLTIYVLGIAFVYGTGTMITSTQDSTGSVPEWLSERYISICNFIRIPFGSPSYDPNSSSVDDEDDTQVFDPDTNNVNDNDDTQIFDPDTDNVNDNDDTQIFDPHSSSANDEDAIQIVDSDSGSANDAETCPSCGEIVPESAAYCPDCGSKL